MTQQTVLITGAFGQVGEQCTQILLDRGRTVIAVDLPSQANTAAERELRAGAHPGTLIAAYADLTDAGAMRNLIATHRPEAIIHLAAILSPVSYRNPALARRVNVGGTQNLLEAAAALTRPPFFLMASSAAVYGSRNPYRYPERITAETQVNPVDQYGRDKVLAEEAVRASGLPYALLRLGGVVSAGTQSSISGDHLVLMRSMPTDNRIHMVDVRDVALAFANAVDRDATIAGKTLLIGGDESFSRLQGDFQDEMMAAVGLGALGPAAGLPGDPDDDRGWSFTGWLDTTEAQELLDFQKHTWSQTRDGISQSMGNRRTVLRAVGPILRPVLRLALTAQRRVEGRGPYADPWTLIGKKYGLAALAAP